MKVKFGRETITTQIAYIAGFFDGEGCIRIKKANQTGNSYYLWVAITNSNKKILDEIKLLFGGQVRKAEQSVNKDIYHYLVTSAEANDFLTTLSPFLKEKKKQAYLGMEFHERKSELTPFQKENYYKRMTNLKR